MYGVAVHIVGSFEIALLRFCRVFNSDNNTVLQLTSVSWCIYLVYILYVCTGVAM